MLATPTSRPSHPPIFSLLAVVSILILATGACSTAVTVHTHEHGDFAGTLTGSDDRYVYLERDADTVAIPHRQVADVDHPGDAARNVGITMLVAGLAAVATPFIGMAAACSDAETMFCSLEWITAGAVVVPIGAVSFFTGVGLTAWGSSTHSDSEQALSRRAPSAPRADLGQIGFTWHW